MRRIGIEVSSVAFQTGTNDEPTAQENVYSTVYELFTVHQIHKQIDPLFARLRCDRLHQRVVTFSHDFSVRGEHCVFLSTISMCVVFPLLVREGLCVTGDNKWEK
jgi:hypothetical protein